MPRQGERAAAPSLSSLKLRIVKHQSFWLEPLWLFSCILYFLVFLYYFLEDFSYLSSNTCADIFPTLLISLYLLVVTVLFSQPSIHAS